VIAQYIEGGLLHVKVKPNSSKTEIEGYDDARKVLIVRVKAPPDKGKVNLELMKFLSKELGKKVSIKSGSRSRMKVLEIK